MQVLHDINLAVDAGQIVALVGANAAGKSTLMFSLAGLRTTMHGAHLDRTASASNGIAGLRARRAAA